MKKSARLIALPLVFVSALASAQVTAFSTINVGMEDPVLGTARYSGMGGAMGALGGNSSTLKDNPAGIATSTKSDVGLTFNVHANSEGKCAFNMNDASAVFNFEHHSNGYVSSAFAITYNRIRNYGRAFYRDGIINYTDIEGDNVYYSTGTFSDEGVEKGGSGEVNLAYAGNINNTVFFGISLGINTMSYEQFSIYNKTSLENDLNIDRHWVYPDDFRREISGVGVNFKAGVIAQPTDFMRVGASIQTPTKYNLKETWAFYYEDFVEGKDGNIESINALIDSEYRYDLHLPFKFNAGLGFMIGDRVNVGIDYSLRNNTKTWVEMGGVSNRELEKDLENLGATQHTVKLGAEVNVVGGLDLRCGYALSTAPMKNADKMKEYAAKVGGIYLDADAETGFAPNYGVTMFGKTHYFTGGIGYTGKIGYVDFAFVRRLAHEQYMEYLPQYAEDYATLNVENNKRGANDFMLTVGLRF